MKITIYRLKSNTDIGFSIHEDSENKLSKKSKNEVCQLWMDPYEGGEAYDTDWDYIDEFKSHADAVTYVEGIYGALEKIAVY